MLEKTIELGSVRSKGEIWRGAMVTYGWPPMGRQPWGTAPATLGPTIWPLIPTVLSGLCFAKTDCAFEAGGHLPFTLELVRHP